VISGHDMTTEAALAKITYLFSRFEDVEEVKRLLGTDLVGELTILGHNLLLRQLRNHRTWGHAHQDKYPK